MSIIASIVRKLYRQPKSFYDDKIIKSIEQNILKSKYTEAFDEIENFKNSDYNFYNTELQKEALIILYKAKILAESGRSNEADELFNWMQMNIVSIENPLLCAKMLSVIANIQEANGELDEALHSIDEAIKKNQSTDRFYHRSHLLIQAFLFYIKAKVYRKKSEVDISISLLEQTLAIYRNLNEQFLCAEPLNTLGICYIVSGDPETGLSYLKESADLFEELNNLTKLLKIYNNRGMTKWQSGNPDQALEDFKQAYEISEMLGITNYSAIISMNIGLISMDKGNFSLSRANFNKSLEYFTELGNDFNVALCYNNLGTLYSYEGDLHKANDYYKKSLSLYEKLGVEDKIAMLYSNLAQSMMFAEKYDEAYSLFLQSYEKYKKLGNPRETVRAIAGLVDISLNTGKVDQASEYVAEIETMAQEIPEERMKQIYMIAKAKVLAISDRLVQRAEAQKLYKEIIDGKIIEFQLTVDAMLGLCSLLLIELRANASEGALDEFKSLVNQIESVVRDDENVIYIPTMIQVLLLKAKLALIDLQLEKGQELMNEAYELSKSNELVHLTTIVEKERTKFNDEMMKYKKLIDTNASLYDRLQETNIENYLLRAEAILRG